jgi:hypothetical protein
METPPTEIDIVTENVPVHDLQIGVQDLLREEVSNAKQVLLVRCGETLALLRVDDDDSLRLYSVVVSSYSPDDQEGMTARVVVHTTNLARPRAARITMERALQLIGERNAEKIPARETSRTWIRLTAEDDSFPGGRVEYDCSTKDKETVEQVRKLFSSWAGMRE